MYRFVPSTLHLQKTYALLNPLSTKAEIIAKILLDFIVSQYHNQLQSSEFLKLVYITR
jgi:hypothetical protein